jgi:hypothetical protein
MPGSILNLGATAGVVYKLGKKQAQQIQEYTGYSPDELSEEELKVAMTELNIESEPLDDSDPQAIATAQDSSSLVKRAQPSGGQDDYIEELQKLAGLWILYPHISPSHGKC